MIVYYAALGHAAVVRQQGRAPQPAVIRGGQDYHVMPEELLLWGLLFGQICHAKQLREIYERQTSQLVSEGKQVLPFNQCLSRLLQRKLIMSGSGYSGEAALYELLANTTLIPIHITLLQKLAGFLHLVFGKRYPVRIAKHLFDRQKLDDDEQLVWRLISEHKLSVLDVITQVEQSTGQASTQRTASQADNLAEVFSLRNRILIAAANLYNKRLLILDII